MDLEFIFNPIMLSDNWFVMYSTDQILSPALGRKVEGFSVEEVVEAVVEVDLDVSYPQSLPGNINKISYSTGLDC